MGVGVTLLLSVIVIGWICATPDPARNKVTVHKIHVPITRQSENAMLINEVLLPAVKLLRSMVHDSPMFHLAAGGH